MSLFGSFEMVFGKYWDHWRYARWYPNGPLYVLSNGGVALSVMVAAQDFLGNVRKFRNHLGLFTLIGIQTIPCIFQPRGFSVTVEAYASVGNHSDGRRGACLVVVLVSHRKKADLIYYRWAKRGGRSVVCRSSPT
ncbi:unnamed protein product [Ectocarpus sp. 8 AP-2014]